MPNAIPRLSVWSPLFVGIFMAACDPPPPPLLEEFPPPRLALMEVSATQAARHHAAPSSLAELRLGYGRRHTTWVPVVVSGWVEMSSVGAPKAAQLSVLPSQHQPRVAAASTPSTLERLGQLDLHWNQPNAQNAGDDVETVRAHLEFNSHRSELELGFKRSRNGDVVRLSTRDPSRISLPDHGANATFQARDGQTQQATYAELRLSLDLVRD